MSGTTLSRSAYERLQAELADLTTRGRVEIAEKIEAARAMGDLSENGDYHAAKDTQGHMERRIREITAILKDAVVLDSVENTGVVGNGSVVTLHYEGDDETEQFLVGSVEERHPDLPVITTGSPLGQALLGHGPGETVEYQAPTGKLRVEIVGVGV
jgi:transcription elongation factor GreA